MINSNFLVRTTSFTLRGTMSGDELAAENIAGFRWWRLRDIASYRGPELFSPRDLATPLAALIAGQLPAAPVPLGLWSAVLII
jgi:8-oxo-dGTP diphosphatase